MARTTDTYSDFQQIALGGTAGTIRIERGVIAWGQQVLRNLNLGNSSNFEKARKICAYLNENFAFDFRRSQSLPEIIARQGGNCVSHALLATFLLRSAGIPAKFAHEVHLTRQYRLISLSVGLWAKRQNDGINSFWHNDHVWLWFQGPDTWEPFDSALKICGFDQFFEKRFFKHSELSRGSAQQWTGPPFAIWEDAGDGLAGMKNITSRVLNAESLQELDRREEYLAFLDLFSGWSKADFHREYLPDPLLRRIKRMSISWFRD